MTDNHTIARSRAGGGWPALILACALATPAAAAPLYTHGQTGLIGLVETWDWTNPIFNFTNANQQFSSRFTAMEDVTIDRVWQAYSQVQTAGNIFNVSLALDDGLGNPGTILGTTTMTLSVGAATHTELAIFPSAINLTTGNVYHVLTTVNTYTEADAVVRVMGDAQSFAVRPYDRAVDPMMNPLSRPNDSSSWTPLAREAFFVFANGGSTMTDVVGGPGMPYTNDIGNSNSYATRGGGLQTLGQQFVIGAEVPAGAVVLVDRLTIPITKTTSGAPIVDPLLLQLRADDGSILRAITVQPGDVDGTAKTYFFDPIFLDQGVTYMLTSQFAGLQPNTSDQRYIFTVLQASVAPGLGQAGWGGTDINFLIQGNATWSGGFPAITNASGQLNNDMVFYFTGVVYVPEPSAALWALGLVMVCRRRG